MSSEEQRQRVLRYLYGDLNQAARAAFQAELERDPTLKALLHAEQRFDQLLPVGSGPQAPEALLQESRLFLRAALRQRERPPLLERLRAWFQFVPMPLSWSAGALAALLVGFFLGRGGLQATPSSLVGLLKPEDLEVVSLRVAHFEPATGQVSLVLDAVSQIQVEGTLQDRAVQTALATALQGDLESGTRLQTLDLLQHQGGSTRIREALIHTLAHDDNPGVRLKAIDALKDLAKNEEVRQALRQALQHDLNPGVRVEAVEALRQFTDPATLQVLERQSRDEVNTYIRGEAVRALQRERKPSGEQL
ncbi:MAG: HEAT repeat domain-containing protein [Candidatus Latescibacteria bacterium]|nr:HEAT repeat domain-containing protein [Candidatus Latescibacterota bacterium]